MSTIDNLICLDPGERGICDIYPKYRAKEPNFTRKAAETLLENLDKTIIITGFPILVDGISGETDGPPGAAALKRAINDLGGETNVLTTDPYTEAMEEMTESLIRLEDIDYEPSLIISIEFPGRSRTGFHDMKGNKIREKKLEKINDFYESQSCPKIAIGDGGNEIGMGNIKDLVIKNVAKGEKIVSEVQADHLVISGISNWGAYGLIGEMSVLEGVDLLHDALEEERMLEICLRNGLIDSVTQKPQKFVDGVPYTVLENFLNLLRSTTRWMTSK